MTPLPPWQKSHAVFIMYECFIYSYWTKCITAPKGFHQDTYLPPSNKVAFIVASGVKL